LSTEIFFSVYLACAEGLTYEKTVSRVNRSMLARHVYIYKDTTELLKEVVFVQSVKESEANAWIIQLRKDNVAQ
jgi:hypothetical protein